MPIKENKVKIRENKINMLVGIIVLLIPFLGFPTTIKNIIFIICGLIIIYISLKSTRREHKKNNKRDKTKDSFAESKPRSAILESIENQIENLNE